ncbi:MAG: SUMF1/EgtB/PvdO family nonheme iron enzyme [Gammaproteobacteria bacterium]
MNSGLLDQLRSAQDLVMSLAKQLDEDDFRTQFHPELSPLGWHLGHCIYTECYWLQEVVQQDSRFTAPLRELYTPPLTPKPERGKKIPGPQAMQQWAQDMQSMNYTTLAANDTGIGEHPLMQDDYLVYFIIQHYSQHYENMTMVLTQRALGARMPAYRVENPLLAKQPEAITCNIEPGHYRVGGKAPLAYDNELPEQQATLGPFRIARKPVANAEFLAFIEAGGYNRQDLWDDAGWQWLQQEKVTAPQNWRRDVAGNWYGIGVRGGYDLHGDDVVHGISLHEAQAYAVWAGGQLPHEHQWEVACRLQQLEDSGRAWEWCGNRFYPYEAFTPFPYREYSQAWFDGRHYTLRGGSLHTRPAIKRASFRNFYQADKRHIFSGLRLVY